MAKAISCSNLILVELDKGVRVRTSIPSENHAALRAGFAGYTANPRWCGSKFVAWRIGRTWRNSLESGKLTVRQDDFMLVPSEEVHPRSSSRRKKQSSFFSGLRRQAPRINDTPQIQQI